MKTLNVREASNSLKKNGYFIVKDYLSNEEVSSIVDLFDRVVEGENSKFNFSAGRAGKIPYHDVQSIALRNVFDNKNIRRVFDSANNRKNMVLEELFFTENHVGTVHATNSLHFDIIPTFKLLIYLDDTSESNGAFSFVPGSHKWTQKFRKSNPNLISYENVEVSHKLPFLGEEISFVGSAGSMILFNSEMFHRASDVRFGHRRVVRGHYRVKESESFLKNVKRKKLN